MEDVVREPVVLIDEDLDAIAGGLFVNVRVSLRNSPIQVNESVNEVSTGNNNNNGGNQRIS